MRLYRLWGKMRGLLPRRARVGRISPDLWQVLSGLPRGNALTYPCAAWLKDGTHHECVLFVEPEVYREHFIGTYGDRDPAIRLESVERIGPSPEKTPLEIERRMEAHGETHMGGYVVIFVLRDGRRYWHLGGDFLEFVSMPAGYHPGDIVDVVFPGGDPQVSAEVPTSLDAPNWKWCFFHRPA